MGLDNNHILVVDDDNRLRELLHQYLSDAGFRVTAAETAEDARHKMESLAFDLVVLDWMMPGEDGIEFAASLRELGRTPILMLTARGEADDRIAGLEAGVDDYLAKPFEPRELVLRIESILRRFPADTEVPTETRMGDVVFDHRREELRRGPSTIHLTASEGRLLKALAENPGSVFSRAELAKRFTPGGGDRAIDVQVNRLRRKIEPEPRTPRYLQTVRGKGYVLRPD